MQYEIFGGAFPAITCKLAAGEAMKTQSGAMIWMDPCIKMETSGGGLGKMFGRVMTGESMMLTTYTAQSAGEITFGVGAPGSILPMPISAGNEIIVQKHGFLCSETGVDMKVHINEKVSGGLFGGEGFLMERFSGNGMLFIECDGELKEVELAAGQVLLVDTGNVLAMEPTVSLEIQRVKGAKNIVFGGEGLFNTKLTGPGKVWLQTLPVPQLAASIIPYIPASN